jgi:acyl carrier protein
VGIASGLLNRLRPARRAPPTAGEFDARVRRVIARSLGLQASDAPAAVEARLLGIDSLDALRLLASLEEEFGIEVDDEALVPAAFESVDAVCCLVRTSRVR